MRNLSISKIVTRLVGISAVLLMLALIACGGDSTETPTVTPEPSQAPTFIPPQPSVSDEVTPTSTPDSSGAPAPTSPSTPGASPASPAPSGTTSGASTSISTPAAGTTPVPPPTTEFSTIPGAIVIPVNAKGANNVGSVEFILSYRNDILELLGVEKGDTASTALMEFRSEAPGDVWTGLIDSEGINGDGPLAIISFRLLKDQDLSTALELSGIEAYNAGTLVDIITEATSGSFKVEGRTFTSPVISFAQ